MSKETSCFEKLQLKHQGFHKNKTSDEEKTVITYIGSYELCKAAFDETRTMTSNPEYGTLEEVNLDPMEGPFWTLELTYAIDIGGNAKSSKGSRLGPKDSTLTVRMMGNPLEMHKNYLKKWNYNLYTTLPPGKNAATEIDNRLNGTWDRLMNEADARYDCIPGDMRPSSWDHKSDLTKTQNFVIAWGKYLNDLPQLFTEDGKQYDWTECASMTKPRS